MKIVDDRCGDPTISSRGLGRIAASKSTSGTTLLRCKWDRTLFSAGNEGQSMVETAMVLPILLLMLLGIFMAGTAFFHYLTLTRAVNTSASDLQNGWGTIAFTSDAPYTDPCTLISTKTASYALGMDTSSITYTIILNNASVYPAESGVTLIPKTKATTFSCTNAMPLTPGSWATIIATYPCDFKIMGIDFTGGQGCNLRAISTVKLI